MEIMASTWFAWCESACMPEQLNYSQSILETSVEVINESDRLLALAKDLRKAMRRTRAKLRHAILLASLN